MNEAVDHPEVPEEVHSIDAYYAGGPGEPYFQPVLSCSCGFETDRSGSWEDAGYEMDIHLQKARGAR